MGRQTLLFPGIMVDEIEARQFGEGVSTVDEMGLPLEGDITERVKSLIEFLNPVGEEHLTIVYHLTIPAYSDFAAKAKARVFARVKNPFEPDIASIKSIQKTRSLPASKGKRNLYEISVEVEK